MKGNCVAGRMEEGMTDLKRCFRILLLIARHVQTTNDMEAALVDIVL